MKYYNVIIKNIMILIKIQLFEVKYTNVIY